MTSSIWIETLWFWRCLSRKLEEKRKSNRCNHFLKTEKLNVQSNILVANCCSSRNFIQNIIQFPGAEAFERLNISTRTAQGKQGHLAIPAPATGITVSNVTVSSARMPASYGGKRPKCLKAFVKPADFVNGKVTCDLSSYLLHYLFFTCWFLHFLEIKMNHATSRFARFAGAARRGSSIATECFEYGPSTTAATRWILQVCRYGILKYICVVFFVGRLWMIQRSKEA